MEFNQVTSLFLAIFVLILGSYLVKKIKVLDHYSIPAPVIGGLLFSLLVFILHSFNLVTIAVDTSLQTLFMLVFFTTVGLGASFKLIKLGGKLLIIYLLAAGFLSLVQNLLGVSLATLLGIHPLLGLMASSPAMIGGHGGAAAFGSTIEGLGIEGAVTVGIAAATLGLVAGGIVGGPVARFLLKKHNLKGSEDIQEQNEILEDVNTKKEVTTSDFFVYLGIITFSMAVGSYLGDTFSNLTGFVLPNYVGAMIVAIIVRSLLDHFNGKIKFDFKPSMNDAIGTVALGIFLAMAMMSIQLWELADLALPILLIVSVHVLFIVLYTIFVVFRILGKNYDAVVMLNGMIGHGLGATPTAMANMSTLTEKFGQSRTAFLIVPIVGAFLVDTINIPIIVFFINLFG